VGSVSTLCLVQVQVQVWEQLVGLMAVAGAASTPMPGCVACLVLTWIWTCVSGHASSGRLTCLEDRLVALPRHPVFLAKSGGHLCTGCRPHAKPSNEDVRQAPRTARLLTRCHCAAHTARHRRYTPRDLGAVSIAHGGPTNHRHSEKEMRTKCLHRSQRCRRSISSNTRPLPPSC
jgi:hypothetical protein